MKSIRGDCSCSYFREWIWTWLHFQAHLLGIFENVNEVEFHEKDYDRMLSVISREGEKIVVCIFDISSLQFTL